MFFDVFLIFIEWQTVYWNKTPIKTHIDRNANAHHNKWLCTIRLNEKKKTIAKLPLDWLLILRYKAKSSIRSHCHCCSSCCCCCSSFCVRMMWGVVAGSHTCMKRVRMIGKNTWKKQSKKNNQSIWTITAITIIINNCSSSSNTNRSLRVQPANIKHIWASNTKVSCSDHYC